MAACRLWVGRLAGAVLVTLVGAILLAATSGPAGAAAAHKRARVCSVQNAGGAPNSAAIGGWTYDVDFVCPFKVSSFSVRTNKRVRAGVDKTGLPSPSGSASLKNGQGLDVACKATSTKSYRCTSKPAVPAHIPVVEGFNSSTACVGKKTLQARLTVNGRTTRVAFNGTTTNGSLTGGCG